jgi:hypothetical protein
MGALAYIAAWLVGMYALDLDEKEIVAGVSGDLVLAIVIGVTYRFAIGRNSGPGDLVVRTAVRPMDGWVALIPRVMSAVNLTYSVMVVLVGPLLMWAALAVPGWGS